MLHIAPLIFSLKCSSGLQRSPFHNDFKDYTAPVKKGNKGQGKSSE